MIAKVNILGSCVSRVSLLDGDLQGHNTSDENIKMDYFLDKQNIVCAMMPPPFPRSEVDAIMPEELWDKQRIKTLKQGINKDTVSMLLNSDAEWLVVDLCDMQNDMVVYKKTMFSSCAHEFFNTQLYKKNSDDIKEANLMKLPPYMWYGYVDLFFEKIMKKYDSNHIILNRFRSNTYYLSKAGYIELVPDQFKQPYHSNDYYNEALTELETYIIDKYNPYVIDLAQYFMGDENLWSNLNGAHFEKAFYRATFDQIKRIIKGETNERYFSNPDFFNEQRRGLSEDRLRKFDVEQGIRVFEQLLAANDLLWINVLDKLNYYAPDDVRVRQYVQCLNEIISE